MPFFRNFPITNYRFGEENASALFQDLTTYIDIIDQIANDGSFYETTFIQDGVRPYVLSYELYQTANLYWTFFLLNHTLRYQGWPMSSAEVYDYAKVYYPNTVIRSDATMHGEFYIGDIVADRVNFDEFGTLFKGRILEKSYDLGQIVIKPIIDVKVINITNPGSGYTSPPTITISGGGGSGATGQAVMTYIDGTEVVTSESLQSIAVLTGGEGYTSAPTITISEPNIPNGVQATATSTLSSFNVPINTTIYSQKDQPDVKQWDDDLVRSLITHNNIVQYNAPQRYIDGSGRDIDLVINASGGVKNRPDTESGTPVSYLDRLIEENNKLRSIKILKPQVANQVNNEFQKLLRT